MYNKEKCILCSAEMREIMKKSIKKIICCLFACGIFVAPFSTFVLADVCQSVTITGTYSDCRGETCYFNGVYFPRHVSITEGYQKCWNTSGQEYIKPYKKETQQGCC